MNDDTQRRGSRPIATVLAASLMLAVAGASAKPPTVQSAATSSASDAYQACLANALARLAVPDAGRVCTEQEAALSAAVLKENPDRPLLAQSYVETLKDTTVDQLRAPTTMAVTVAQRTRP